MRLCTGKCYITRAWRWRRFTCRRGTEPKCSNCVLLQVVYQNAHERCYKLWRCTRRSRKITRPNHRHGSERPPQPADAAELFFILSFLSAINADTPSIRFTNIFFSCRGILSLLLHTSTPVSSACLQVAL